MSQSQKLEVGQIVPDFTGTVQNPDGTTAFNLKEALAAGQKVLLIFYPGDDTPGCTTQLCGVRDVYTTYQKYGVKVLGVNPASGESHLKFIKKHEYQFGIIVDEDKSIREMFGAVGSFFGKPTTKRSVFLIDTDGKLIFKHNGQHDNQRIFELLEEMS